MSEQWQTDHVALPEGWVLDPDVPEHRPEIGVWWVILPDGTRTAWNGGGRLHCHICEADPERMPDCSVCAGRGVIDHVPYCDRPWDEIVPGLWLGGHGCQPSGGECFLTDTDFDMVVSLYRDPDPRYEPPESATHFRHRMADADLDPEHHTELDTLAAHVEDAVRHGDKVLVRCQAGINRAALVTGLALLKMGWTAGEAITRMREVRSPYVLFNRSFTAYLHSKETRPDARG